MNLTIEHEGKQLVLFGALLFLLGLIEGVLIPHFSNPRMALSAHLAAVQSGLALMVFGVIWSLVDLNRTQELLARYGTIFSMYLIWSSITLAAINGASQALPLAGAGHAASQWGEWLVTVLVYTGSLLGMVAAFLMLLGLYRSHQQYKA